MNVGEGDKCDTLKNKLTQIVVEQTVYVIWEPPAFGLPERILIYCDFVNLLYLNPGYSTKSVSIAWCTTLVAESRLRFVPGLKEQFL